MLQTGVMPRVRKTKAGLNLKRWFKEDWRTLSGDKDYSKGDRDTNEGDTVLDNTMGSGTTGVACMNTHRNFIGIEMEETYFNIEKDRIESTNPLGV